MGTQNNFSAANNLIEELGDEELATCTGGCGWHWKRSDGVIFQGDLVDLDDKRYTFTAYWVDNDGDIESNSFHVGKDQGLLEKAGIYYDSSPQGSNRFWSDRHIKESFAEVNVQQVLEKVAALPITTWKYSQEPDNIRHIGPMAQDFAASFGVGDSDHSIHVVDANGVTLAAIQALYQMLLEKSAEITALHQELNHLKQQIA